MVIVCVNLCIYIFKDDRVDEDKNTHSPPRTRVIKTKYGEVQGRIFHLTTKKVRKEEGRSSQAFSSKDSNNIYNRERNSGGYGNGDTSASLPPVAIYYGIPYATPPVGSNR